MIRAVFTTVVLAFAPAIATADTITVCLDGSCDYSDIQEAINAASDGDVIEIAAGTYYPAATINTLGKAVTLSGVPGKGKDDAPMSVIDGQDSIRVLICENDEGADTVFENLLITGGLAEGSWPDSSGGGMFNEYSSPTLTNCTFEGNSADSSGGGMYNSDSSPTIKNCTFNQNSAGGSGFKPGEHDENVVPCPAGGGMCILGGSPTIENCVFSNNWGGCQGGGGMFNSSSPSLTDCTFTGNSATQGGGMYNWYESSPTLTNCTFTDNLADYGGGMYNWGSSPTLVNCTFAGNLADGYGGGMYNYGSPTLTGCMFTGNSASGYSGGGMYNRDSSSPTLTGCMFTECCKIEPPNSFIDGGRNDFAGNPYVACDECRADVDCDEEVNAADLGLLLSAWDTTEAQYDIDGDGVVGGGDLGMLLGTWGPCP